MRGQTRQRTGSYSLRLFAACLAIFVQDGSAAADAPNARDDRPVLLFLGTSLTAGYGLPLEQAYPALIQRRIDEAGLGYRVVNAGVSGDTSAGGRRRIDWLLRSRVSILFVELGANDMLRGLDPAAMKRNLEAIFDRARERNAGVRFVIGGMRAAPNLGPSYAESFEAVFPTLARRYDAVLIPFLLDGVAGERRLNQADGIHPTAEGQRKIAELVWRYIEPTLKSEAASHAALPPADKASRPCATCAHSLESL